MERYRALLLMPALLFLSGCAPLLFQHISLPFERPAECQALLEGLDKTVEEARVRDGSNAPVPSFPYLRANRFLAALKKNLKDHAQREQWVQRFVLFSMGIPSIGSMRQRGHHAIELIGRTLFDDPHLYDRNFMFK